MSKNLEIFGSLNRNRPSIIITEFGSTLIKFGLIEGLLKVYSFLKIDFPDLILIMSAINSFWWKEEGRSKL